MIRIGYACINMQLSEQGIRTGRSLIDRKFKQGGLQLAAQVALANAQDLIKILQWNEQHGIRLFRIGSELFPRWDHYQLEDLPKFEEISKTLFRAGEYARAHGHRLTTHPGPFHVLGSPNNRVVSTTITGLERHSQLFDLMGFEPSYQNKINIHIGATYGGNKYDTTQRWLENYSKLSSNCRARLVVENDDKASMYSVSDLYRLIHEYIPIPITFDYYHHSFCTGGLSEQEALMLARKTWELYNVTQCVHYSESRRREQQQIVETICRKNNIEITDLPAWPTFAKLYKEFTKIKQTAHADFITKLPDTYNVDSLDIMVEAKAKEQALLALRKQTMKIIS